eukprot:2517407-Karenia_brevis.AAC.1
MAMMMVTVVMLIMMMIIMEMIMRHLYVMKITMTIFPPLRTLGGSCQHACSCASLLAESATGSSERVIFAVSPLVTFPAWPHMPQEPPS